MGFPLLLLLGGIAPSNAQVPLSPPICTPRVDPPVAPPPVPSQPIPLTVPPSHSVHSRRLFCHCDSGFPGQDADGNVLTSATVGAGSRIVWKAPTAGWIESSATGATDTPHTRSLLGVSLNSVAPVLPTLLIVPPPGVICGATRCPRCLDMSDWVVGTPCQKIRGLVKRFGWGWRGPRIEIGLLL